MRTKFIAFKTAIETAAEAECEKQYLKVAQFWRKAYQLAPSTPDEDWCFARADYCFKAAIDTGAIKVRKSRQLDFNFGRKDMSDFFIGLAVVMLGCFMAAALLDAALCWLASWISKHF